MHPGAILSRAGRLYAVLASDDRAIAVAPIALTARQRHAGDVEVNLGPLGRATAICASASVERGVWSVTGISLPQVDLSACRIAAARVKREEALWRFSARSVLLG